MINTQGNYSKAVGFIDIVFKLWNVSLGKLDELVGAVKWEEDPLYLVHHLIEVKTPKDFCDVGAIIRQVKYQKEVYLRNLKSYKSDRSHWEIYRSCVLSTFIPETAKNLFECEGIVFFELEDQGQTPLTKY